MIISTKTIVSTRPLNLSDAPEGSTLEITGGTYVLTIPVVIETSLEQDIGDVICRLHFATPHSSQDWGRSCVPFIPELEECVSAVAAAGIQASADQVYMALLEYRAMRVEEEAYLQGAAEAYLNREPDWTNYL